MAERRTKPYVKLAATLASLGIAIFFLERFGLTQMRQFGTFHVDGTLLSIMVIAPVVLVLAGALVFMIGKMRRL